MLAPCRSLFKGLSWGAAILILAAAGWAILQNLGYAPLIKVHIGTNFLSNDHLAYEPTTPCFDRGLACMRSAAALQDWAAHSAMGRSGFLAAFSLIFLSEIGDKTFFLAGLLALKV